METSLTPQATLVRPWRTATLVAVGVAIVEFALVVALVVTLLSSADDGVAAPSRTQETQKPAKPKVAPMLPRAKTRVLILNGNGQAGAAATQADGLRALGYRIAGVGNADRSDYGRSTVLYRSGRRREARRLAADLGIKLVGPLDGISSAGLGGAAVAVILGQ